MKEFHYWLIVVFLVGIILAFAAVSYPQSIQSVMRTCPPGTVACTNITGGFGDEFDMEGASMSKPCTAGSSDPSGSCEIGECFVQETSGVIWWCTAGGWTPGGGSSGGGRYVYVTKGGGSQTMTTGQTVNGWTLQERSDAGDFTVASTSVTIEEEGVYLIQGGINGEVDGDTPDCMVWATTVDGLTSSSAAAAADTTGTPAANEFFFQSVFAMVTDVGTVPAAVSVIATECLAGSQAIVRSGSTWMTISSVAAVAGSVASGDVEDVGDCGGPTCFKSGGSGNSLWFAGPVAGGVLGELTAAEPTSTRTWTIPDETGTLCTTGSVCSGYASSGHSHSATPPGGLDTEVQFNSSGSFEGDPEFAWIAGGDRVTIGEGDYTWGGLSVYDDVTTEMGITSVYVGSTATSGGTYVAGKAAGTIGAEAAVPDGDLIRRDWSVGHDGAAGFLTGCVVDVTASGLWSASNRGSDWTLNCLKDNDVTQGYKRIEVLADGVMNLTFDGTNGVSVDASGVLSNIGTGSVEADTTDCAAGELLDGGSTCYTTSGNSTVAGTTSGTLTNGNCAEFDSNGNIVDSGGTCGGGGGGDHGGLTGLLDDDHKQYLLLAGRSGTSNDATVSTDDDGSFTGSGTTAKDLVLDANSADTTGEIRTNSQVTLFEDIPDIVLFDGHRRAVRWLADADLSGAAQDAFIGLDLSPTVHLGQAAGTFPGLRLVSAQGELTTDDSTASAFALFQMFRNDFDINSEVNGEEPSGFITFADNAVSTYTGTTTATRDSGGVFPDTTYSSRPSYVNTSSGKYDSIDGNIGLDWKLTMAANGTADMEMTIARGVYIRDAVFSGSGAGSEVLEALIGIEIERLDSGINFAGIRNASPYVASPSQTVVAATFTITVDAGYMELSAGSNVTSDTTTAINAGIDGQIVTFSNTDTGSDTVTFKDNANTQMDGDFTLNPGDTLTMIYDATEADWLEISRADNDSSDAAGGNHNDTGTYTCFGGGSGDATNEFFCMGASATAADADWVPREALTVVGFACAQAEDPACTVGLTFAKNGTTTGSECSLVNVAACSVSGLSSSFNGSTDGMTIKVTTAASGCANLAGYNCVIEFDYD